MHTANFVNILLMLMTSRHSASARLEQNPNTENEGLSVDQGSFPVDDSIHGMLLDFPREPRADEDDDEESEISSSSNPDNPQWEKTADITALESHESHTHKDFNSDSDSSSQSNSQSHTHRIGKVMDQNQAESHSSILHLYNKSPPGLKTHHHYSHPSPYQPAQKTQSSILPSSSNVPCTTQHHHTHQAESRVTHSLIPSSSEVNYNMQDDKFPTTITNYYTTHAGPIISPSGSGWAKSTEPGRVYHRPLSKVPTHTQFDPVSPSKDSSVEIVPSYNPSLHNYNAPLTSPSNLNQVKSQSHIYYHSSSPLTSNPPYGKSPSLYSQSSPSSVHQGHQLKSLHYPGSSPLTSVTSPLYPQIRHPQPALHTSQSSSNVPMTSYGPPGPFHSDPDLPLSMQSYGVNQNQNHSPLTSSSIPYSQNSIHHYNSPKTVGASHYKYPSPYSSPPVYTTPGSTQKVKQSYAQTRIEPSRELPSETFILTQTSSPPSHYESPFSDLDPGSKVQGSVEDVPISLSTYPFKLPQNTFNPYNSPYSYSNQDNQYPSGQSSIRTYQPKINPTRPHLTSDYKKSFYPSPPLLQQIPNELQTNSLVQNVFDKQLAQHLAHLSIKAQREIMDAEYNQKPSPPLPSFSNQLINHVSYSSRPTRANLGNSYQNTNEEGDNDYEASSTDNDDSTRHSPFTRELVKNFVTSAKRRQMKNLIQNPESVWAGLSSSDPISSVVSKPYVSNVKGSLRAKPTDQDSNFFQGSQHYQQQESISGFKENSKVSGETYGKTESQNLWATPSQVKGHRGSDRFAENFNSRADTNGDVPQTIYVPVTSNVVGGPLVQHYMVPSNVYHTLLPSVGLIGSQVPVYSSPSSTHVLLKRKDEQENLNSKDKDFSSRSALANEKEGSIMSTGLPMLKAKYKNKTLTLSLENVPNKGDNMGNILSTTYGKLKKSFGF